MKGIVNPAPVAIMRVGMSALIINVQSKSVRSVLREVMAGMFSVLLILVAKKKAIKSRNLTFRKAKLPESKP